MITVDLQVLGNRHRDIKNGLSTPPKFTIPNMLNLSTKSLGDCAISSVIAAGLSAILLDTLKTYPTSLLYLLGQKNNSTLA